MKPKAIVFDLFHTLVSVKTDSTSGRSTSEILGVPEHEWNRLIFEQSEDRLCGRMMDAVEIISALVKLGSWDVPHGKIEEAAQTRQKRFAEGIKAVRPHVLQTLDRIRQAGVLTGLCSNADWPERKGWDNTPLSGRFDATIFSCDVGYLKPQKEIYQACLDGLKVQAKDAIFVGDGNSNELIGARAVGMRTVLTTEIISRQWPEVIEQRKNDADHVISNIEQILDCL